MTNPELDKNQHDVVDSSRGFNYSFGILMLIFIVFTIIQYFK